jgi:tRNA nucleotidyltransferase/poly(A) polymerase
VDRNLILSVLQKFRPLFSYVVDAPDKLLSELAAIIPSRHMVFPCDIIDLRLFLSKEKISFFNPLPVFSLRFAEKYLKEYSVFMVLDTHAIKADTYSYGGIQLNLTDSLDISNSLLRIIVNEPAAEGSFDQVKQIVEDLGVGVECLVSNSVPGISSPSQKLSIVHKKKYKFSQTTEISLTPDEQKIFEHLKDVVPPGVQMRVAGGWIRDKLLGKESDDIDIAVNMPGYELARMIAGDKAHQVSLEKSADPNEIKSNDDMNVGAVYLQGQKIEFVPMRTEHYPDEESRQPSIKLTNDPREDVKRRDLTINALYYNIRNGQIEDYVNGRADLGLDENGKPGGPIYLRTPDEPMKTFHEDPLRLLRVLRFHARYPNSVVDPSIIEAMQDPDIQESYMKKVAPERAGPEIRKMMETDNPVSAIKLFLESGLYQVAFGLKDADNLHEDRLRMDQRSPWHQENLLNHTIKVVENLQEILPPGTDEETRRKKSLTMLAGMLHDFGKMDLSIQTLKKNNPAFEGHTQYIGHENASERMTLKILNDIGTTKEEKNFVGTLVGAHMMPHKANEWMNAKKTQKGMGQLIEKLKIKGKGGSDDMFEYAFYHAQADAQAGKNDFNQEEFDQGREHFRQYYEDPAIVFTRTQGPVIRGDVVKSIFDNLVTTKGVNVIPTLINDTVQHLIQMQYTRKIDMSFASLPEGDERQAAMQNSQNDAMNKAKSFMYGNYQKYLKPQEEVNAMGKNWFKKATTSPPLSELRSVPTDYDNDPEVKKGPAEARPKYYKGMKVRDRRKGIINPQEYGVVDTVRGNQVKIIWDPDSKEKKREEIFDMIEDTEILSLIVAEV